jgi:ketosteroid isomerase-like protein
MSEENVEALKRAAAAVKKNDPSILDGLLDPDVIWEVTSANAGIDLLGTYRGIDEVRRFFGRWEQAWAEWDWEHEEMQAVGDHVVARMHVYGRGRHSGIELEADTWQVWTFRFGKVVRYRDFEHREEALEAAGLSE